MDSFCHLRLYSDFSLGEGMVRIDQAVVHAKKLGMSAIGLSDSANFFGLVKFHLAARRQGLKPISACEVWVEEPGLPLYRLLFIVRGYKGYLCLCRLLTQAYEQQGNCDHPAVKLSWLMAEDLSGLILLAGGANGDVGGLMAQGEQERAREQARRWKSLFPDRYYLEIQRSGLPTDALVPHWSHLGQELDLPVVATHPVRFLTRADYQAFDVRVCIANNARVDDLERKKDYTEEQYFKSTGEMQDLFADVPAALDNAVILARRATLTMPFGEYHLPDFPLPQKTTAEKYLRAQAEEGLVKRLNLLYPAADEREGKRAEYYNRLDRELTIIESMAFSGYFLVVADFISWAKQQNIPVGPGRGSGAGSLVAYSLGITELDPLRYGLIFERFLNPERVSLPDFDIDFCQEGRDRVIDYVKEKYGRLNVSQIVTFNTMAARAAVRNIGRVLGKPVIVQEMMTKLIPRELDITLEKARQQEPQLEESIQNNVDGWAELWPIAQSLEGVTQGIGMHAGGVLIAPSKLSDFCPLYSAVGSDVLVSQLDKDDLEKLGLVKFDFLGLTTLTIINETLHHLEHSINPVALDIGRIPLDDEATYSLFAAGATQAVFQFESEGMKELLKQARPNSFEHLIALVALYRPGPMQHLPTFVNRMRGREKVSYLHPSLEPILADTYGLMVYQEQVMRIAQDLSGFSMGKADRMRAAMSKKKMAELAMHRSAFVVGAQERGINVSVANEIFDMMVEFGNYGFNKSHAATYALVAYQTAYLKAHHPAAFYAANLSASMRDTDRIHDLMEDARANQLVVRLPDINRGHYRFSQVDESAIAFGLGAIKGVGEKAIHALVSARDQAGPFKDLSDLCLRLDKKELNRRVAQALVGAGAMDAIEPNRAQAMADLEHLYSQGDVSQSGLFRDVAVSLLPKVKDWSEQEKLKKEKEALGFYMSGHPFEFYRTELVGLHIHPLSDMTSNGQNTLRAGILIAQRTLPTKRGKIAFITLEDGVSRLEATLLSSVYLEQRNLLKNESLLLVSGKVSEDFRGTSRFTAQKIYSLSDARLAFAKSLHLTLNGEANAEKLMELLQPHAHGTCPVQVSYVNKQGVSCRFSLPEDWKVFLPDELIHTLTRWLSPENVHIQYRQDLTS